MARYPTLGSYGRKALLAGALAGAAAAAQGCGLLAYEIVPKQFGTTSTHPEAVSADRVFNQVMYIDKGSVDHTIAQDGEEAWAFKFDALVLNRSSARWGDVQATFPQGVPGSLDGEPVRIELSPIYDPARAAWFYQGIEHQGRGIKVSRAAYAADVRSPHSRQVPWESFTIADGGLLFNEALVDLVETGIAEQKQRGKIVGWGEAVKPAQVPAVRP